MLTTKKHQETTANTGAKAGLFFQPKLTVNAPNDRYEQEADVMADRVMRMKDPATSDAFFTSAVLPIQRKCKHCEEEENHVHRKESGTKAPQVNAGFENYVSSLGIRGKPLSAQERSFFEPRFNRDFSDVRVHTDSEAAHSAQGINALAYTSGNNIVFNSGQYQPGSDYGKRLLAHELTHVVQQEGAGRRVRQRDSPGTIQRQEDDRGVVTGSASACGIPSECPATFCTPFPSTLIASAARDSMAPVLLEGIAAKVSPRVVFLWRQYLYGGSPSRDLSSHFGSDFTTSLTTFNTTTFLVNALISRLTTFPPVFPPGQTSVVLDIRGLIPAEIAQIDTPGDPEVMDFNVIGEIPGNIAGGVGRTQLSCPVGAQPSPFDDAREANGTVIVTQQTNGTLLVQPNIGFTVVDTIDLCPGNCGASLEQVATIPMSKMEASGISGDVPFVVNFPSPPVSAISIAPSTPPTLAPPVPGTISGQVTASVLRIRERADLSAPISGRYRRNETIAINCQVTGSEVDGNNVWYQTDQGFVSARYVTLLGSAPALC